MAQERFLTIEFVDGTTRTYAFPVYSPGAQSQSRAAKQMKLESFFKDRFLVLHGEGKLLVFPLENIKSVQLSSDDQELEGIRMPTHTITGVRLIT
jgi:hypothetical protein